MRVLWICNIVIPRIATAIGLPVRSNGGWLTGICDSLIKEDNLLLGICFPNNKKSEGDVDGIKYFGFSDGSIEEMKGIITSFHPDVIHIWGTEFSHSLSMLKAAQAEGLIDNTVVSIQGLVSIYAKHYFSGLPGKVIKGFSLRDFIKHDNIAAQKRKFEVRGKSEIATIKMAKHIIGRTDWDRATTERINRNAKYHFCNETLRPSFYQHKGQWLMDKCEKHSIFVSQSHYPIKGFHMILEAMKDIVQEFPDAILYTTGNSPFETGGKSVLHKTYYNRYIGKLIRNYDLKGKIIFLGNLDETQMCERFLKSNIFVSCSSIENSPNSVGEAMLLGVPVVSSDVGGVRNLLVDKCEGSIYPFDEPYMCAFYIIELFRDQEKMQHYSLAASHHAAITHDPVTNKEQLISIYHEISREG